MPLFTLASASGSLGVTTLSVGLALTWPRPVVLVEADPSGGSAILAGYCTGLARPGLSELVLAHRHHQLAEELPSRLFPLADSNASLLPGLRSHQQAASLLGVWDELLDALRGLEQTRVDVIVDAGRLGTVGSPEPLVTESDVTAVVTGTGLPELARVRSWVPRLQEGAAGEVRLVIAGRVRPYTSSEVAKTLGVPVVGEVAWDADAARWWSHGEPQRRFDRSPLGRSAAALGTSLRALAPRVDEPSSSSGRGAAMTKQPPPTWVQPDLASVPLFTAFGDAASGAGRAGRVRSRFALPTSGTPSAPASALHWVGRDSQPHAAGHGEDPAGEVDWDAASELRTLASKRFSDRVGQAPDADEYARQELGRTVIMEVVQVAAESRFAALGTVWSAGQQDALAQAVFDLMFGLGRLQPLVNRPDVENIIVVGHDRVFLDLAGGKRVPGPPVAASDEELVQLVQDLASRADPPRVFSDSNPDLHLNLDGARLAASSFVTHRPSMVIRVHRLVRITLDDLAGLETVSPLLASFLAAAVKARLSIVVSGQQGDGKTTLLRALCAEIGPEEVLGTFETERELGLEQLVEEHPVVFSWEARPGSGERGPDGRPVNEFTLQDALHASFRYALDRQIVGEVRGREVAQMIMAMESGSGSLSTTHAASASDTMEKLVSCAMQSGEFTREAAVMKLARCLGLVVQLRSMFVRGRDGAARKQRVVDEVLAITPGEDSTGYAATTVFRRDPHGPAVAFVLPDHLRGLVEYGFTANEFLLEAQRHGGVA